MKQLFLFLFSIITISINATDGQSKGNPFAKFNYKVNIATFDSDNEFHDTDNVVEICSVLFDTRTKEVVGYVQEKDTLVELVPDMTSTSIDPLCEKYYSISPYVYCLNNPVRFVDPDGREVIALDEESRRNITNSLTEEEAKYIKFKKDGTLNTKKLNKSKSESENMTALKTLANSETKYKFQVTDKDIDGEAFSLTYKGLTAIPGEELKGSPDNDVWILTSSYLDEKSQTENMAHEAYGHGYFYELGKTDKNYDYHHRYESVLGKPEWDPEFQIYIYPSIRTETNLKLKKQIDITTRQAGANYDSRRRK